MAVKPRQVQLVADRTARYDRVVVDGMIHPLSAVVQVANGDHLQVTLEYDIPPEAHVAWWEEGKPMPPEAIIDIYARDLARRRQKSEGED